MHFDLNSLIEIISLLFGGGIGAAIMQLYTAKVNKNKLAAEAEDTMTEVARKKQDALQDAFDTMYQELNQCLKDYTAISEEYREHREKMRKYEESVQEQIHTKCVELAELKSKVTYLKGIRCYNTLCPHRIKTNPDRLATPQTAPSTSTETPQETPPVLEQNS